MFLQRIRLRNFRNFIDEVLEFPERGAALIGDNGQGKTNLLEAVYYLEIFRSFRGARDDQLISFGGGHFRVEGHLADAGGQDGRAVDITAGYARDVRRKKVTIDGNEAGRVAEAIGRVGTIIFTASDVEIVAGGPSARRRFIDIILSLVEPGYLAALQRYRQVLAQRNGLLRDGAGAKELSAWNAGLVEAGSRICAARANWVEGQRASFAAYCASISGGQPIDLRYVPSLRWPGGKTAGRADWAEAFHVELDRLGEVERRRGQTVVGPHRDDLAFWWSEGGERVQLRNFGSAGQQRTAAIGLRMAEAATLRTARGRRPIVMLDDVFAELDPLRAERVMELLGAEEWGQVFLTSPKPGEFAVMGDRLPQYRVADGRVRAV